MSDRELVQDVIDAAWAFRKITDQTYNARCHKHTDGTCTLNGSAQQALWRALDAHEEGRLEDALERLDSEPVVVDVPPLPVCTVRDGGGARVKLRQAGVSEPSPETMTGRSFADDMRARSRFLWFAVGVGAGYLLAMLVYTIGGERWLFA